MANCFNNASSDAFAPTQKRTELLQVSAVTMKPGQQSESSATFTGWLNRSTRPLLIKSRNVWQVIKSPAIQEYHSDGWNKFAISKPKNATCITMVKKNRATGHGDVSIYLYGTLTLSILTITQRHGVVSSKCSVGG